MSTFCFFFSFIPFPQFDSAQNLLLENSLFHSQPFIFYSSLIRHHIDYRPTPTVQYRSFPRDLQTPPFLISRRGSKRDSYISLYDSPETGLPVSALNHSVKGHMEHLGVTHLHCNSSVIHELAWSECNSYVDVWYFLKEISNCVQTWKIHFFHTKMPFYTREFSMKHSKASWPNKKLRAQVGNGYDNAQWKSSTDTSYINHDEGRGFTKLV